MVKGECLIIAGEKSGEEHAMSFLPALLERNSELSFFGVGGEEMKDQGVELLYHLKDFSSWGFSEVIGKIPFYFKALKNIVAEVERRNCQYAILIDFQDFNLRLAKKLSQKGVQIFYYVAPQAWAWKAYRAKTLEETVNTLFTIIPFEKKWFQDRGVQRVKGVPHPLWFHYKDKINKDAVGLEAKPFRKEEKKKLLLLPGSRNFEVQKLLPIFNEYISQHHEEFEVRLVQSPNVDLELYRPYWDKIEQVYPHDDIARALTWSEFALAASGTVTLTCALFEVPTIVCYSSSLLNEYIFYTFLSYDGPISLANIVHEKRVFPELVQGEVSSFNIAKQMEPWLHSQKAYESVKSDLAQTLEKISGDGMNVGHLITELMEESSSPGPEKSHDAE